VRHWSKAPNLYKRFDEVKDSYATVVRQLRQEGLPEVFAGIPMTESCYKPEPVSPCCAKGWWQWMPEAGVRFSTMPGFGADYSVKDCAWKNTDGTEPFNPDRPAPVPGSCNPTSPKADYIAPGPTCLLSGCRVDFRTDLELSTKASLKTLREAFEDPEIRSSGAATQVAIASHNAGYDDARLYTKNPPNKPYNMLPSYRRWTRDNAGQKPASHFYGDALRCSSRDAVDQECQRYMMFETQGYAVKVIAQHLLAVCYYAQNYPGDPIFATWGQYLGEGEYCSLIPVPAADELRKVRSGPVCP
jgi:hypothetical protein